MAVDKNKAEKEIIEVIRKNNLTSILEIFAFYTKISRATFYNWSFDKLDSIEKAIDDNKVKTKKSLKNKWLKSDNATLQIALFRLLSNDTELEKLTSTRIDAKITDDKIKRIEIVDAKRND